MDVGFTLLVAIVMAFVAWVVTSYNQVLGKYMAFAMTLPILIPLIILYFSAIISIQNAAPENMAKATDIGISAILQFFESHIVDAVIGDIAGTLVGAFIAIFTSKA